MAGHRRDGLSRGTRLEARLASLNEQRLDVFEDYAQARLSTGEFAQIAADLRQHLAAWPIRERGWELLMLALYRSGNAPGALAAYHQARAALAEQLGIEPGRRLQWLHRSMLNRDPALEPRPPQELVALASPPPPAAPQPTTGLPAGPVPPPPAVSPVGSVPRQLPPAGAELVGRDDERAAVAAALRGKPQAVMLTGPAGVGKSTLALHAAHTVAVEYPDGHVVLDLDRTGAAPPDPARVLAAVLRALTGTPLEPWTGPDPGALGELTEIYRSVASHRRALILLDGATDTEQVRPLLTGAGGCTLLITSRRQRLPLPRPPHHLQIPPLPTREAVTLLTRYAGSVRAGTEPEAVEELARRCHGLPLALRIAGDWLARRPALPARLLATHLARRPLDGLCIGNLSVRAALAADLRAVAAEDPLAEPVFRLLGQTDAATPEELADPAGTDPSRAGRHEGDRPILTRHRLHPTGPDGEPQREPAGRRPGQHDLLPQLPRTHHIHQIRPTSHPRIGHPRPIHHRLHCTGRAGQPHLHMPPTDLEPHQPIRTIPNKLVNVFVSLPFTNPGRDVPVTVVSIGRNTPSASR